MSDLAEALPMRPAFWGDGWDFDAYQDAHQHNEQNKSASSCLNIHQSETSS
jgi:hypothetical protein